jgi:hypothetical protein
VVVRGPVVEQHHRLPSSAGARLTLTFRRSPHPDLCHSRLVHRWTRTWAFFPPAVV